jgi:hypothetical protein
VTESLDGRLGVFEPGGSDTRSLNHSQKRNQAKGLHEETYSVEFICARA